MEFFLFLFFSFFRAHCLGSHRAYLVHATSHSVWQYILLEWLVEHHDRHLTRRAFGSQLN